MDIAETAPQTVILATTTAVWAAQGQTPLAGTRSNRDKISFCRTLNLHSGERSPPKSRP